MSKIILKISGLIICFCITSSCQKDNIVGKLEQDFHGKYSIVSATSNREVDINLDGTSNKDLLKEIDLLYQSYLELILPSNSEKYVYSQFWQNQYFIGGSDKIPAKYDPNILVNYVNQATVASFIFNDDKSLLLLSRDHPDPSFPIPITVEVLLDIT